MDVWISKSIVFYFMFCLVLSLFSLLVFFFFQNKQFEESERNERRWKKWWTMKSIKNNHHFGRNGKENLSFLTTCIPYHSFVIDALSSFIGIENPKNWVWRDRKGTKKKNFRLWKEKVTFCFSNRFSNNRSSGLNAISINFSWFQSKIQCKNQWK